MTSSASRAHDPSTRGPLGLWLCLAALVLLRGVLAFVPSMWGWGWNLLRFTQPVAGWALWALAAAALIPQVSRAALPAWRRAGEALARSWRAPLILAATLAAILFVQPDRVHLVGDFLLRSGTAERAMHPEKLYPQALPLDVLLHYELPRALAGVAVPVDVTARALGALEGGALALLATLLARSLQMEGAGLVAVVLVSLSGGFLGLFTSYGKAVAELALLGFATAVAGIRVTRDVRSGFPLALCLALGLFLHRSALALLPAGGYAWWRGWRASPPAARRPRALLWALLPVAALAIMLPRIVATMLRWDPVHLVPAEVAREGGIARAVVSPLHLLDLWNVLAVVAPLLLAALWLAASDRSREGAAERRVTLLLTLPWWPVLLVLRPPQGLFRDWDDFAPAGAALCVWTACLLGLALRRRPRWEWLAVTATCGALAPAELWLAHHVDLDRGLQRVQAYLGEPPARPETERGLTWDWLGIRAAQLGRWDLATASLARAAETTPSPRVLSEWGLAERERGNETQAQDLFRRVTRLTPDDANAWYRLAATSWRLGDYDECLRATLELQRLEPGSETVTHMLDDLRTVRPQHEPPR